jgi:hypothetical protein
MNKVIYDGYTVQLPNDLGGMEKIGGLHDPVTVSRLVAAGAFIYVTEAGNVSVRLESKARGPLQGYWSAYKRIGGKLHKTYIAASFALDPYNLEEASQRLLSSTGEELPNTCSLVSSFFSTCSSRQGDPHE